MTEAATTPVVAREERAHEDDGVRQRRRAPGRRAGRWSRAGPRPCRYARGSMPMNVKNGIAISSWLDMMPKSRSRQRLQQRGLQHPELEADEREDDPVGREREGDGVAQQQERHQHREHEGRHRAPGPRLSPPARRGARSRAPARAGASRTRRAGTPTRLIVSETPCRMSRANPAGNEQLHGPAQEPAGVRGHLVLDATRAGRAAQRTRG